MGNTVPTCLKIDQQVQNQLVHSQINIMTKIIFFCVLATTLIAIAQAKNVLTDDQPDCMKCAEDIKKNGEDCAKLHKPVHTHKDFINCVLDSMLTKEQCTKRICEFVAVLNGFDPSICHDN